VLADPQGNTKSTSLTVTGHWGDPDDSEVKTTYYGSIKATIDNSATIYDTGKSFTIDASAIAGDYSLTTVTLQGEAEAVFVTNASGSAYYPITGTYSNVRANMIRYGEAELFFKQSSTQYGSAGKHYWFYADADEAKHTYYSVGNGIVVSPAIRYKQGRTDSTTYYIKNS
jgi:hypothetical protein